MGSTAENTAVHFSSLTEAERILKKSEKLKKGIDKSEICGIIVFVLRMWWNRQTRQIKGLVMRVVQVQVLSSAPNKNDYFDRIVILIFLPETPVFMWFCSVEKIFRQKIKFGTSDIVILLVFPFFFLQHNR